MYDLDSLIERFRRVSFNQPAYDYHYERARLAEQIADCYRQDGDSGKATEWSRIALGHEEEGDHLASLRIL